MSDVPRERSADGAESEDEAADRLGARSVTCPSRCTAYTCSHSLRPVFPATCRTREARGPCAAEHEAAAEAGADSDQDSEGEALDGVLAALHDTTGRVRCEPGWERDIIQSTWRNPALSRPVVA